MEWISGIAALSGGLAAVLAWLAKIYWSREFAAAKDEIVKAKDAQIELLKNENAGLKDLTPMKIREYFLSVKQQLEEYNDNLWRDLQVARQEIQDREVEICELKNVGTEKQVDLLRLEKERDELRAATASLENVTASRERQGSSLTRVLLAEPKDFEDVDLKWRTLRNFLTHDRPSRQEPYFDLLRTWLDFSSRHESDESWSTLVRLMSAVATKSEDQENKEGPRRGDRSRGNYVADARRAGSVSDGREQRKSRVARDQP